MTLTAGLTWPAIARTPRAPLGSAVARPILESRHPAAAGDRPTYPDGVAIARPATPPTAPGVRAGPPVGLLRPARQGHHDRLRRGLHGRGLEGRRGHRPGRPADAVRGAAHHRWCRSRCSGCARWWTSGCRAHQENTLEGSRENISAHYDLSNELFAAFLDPTMTYSAAWFEERPALRRAPRGGAAAQDRRHPRPGRRRRGHPGAGDRHRLGRPGDPRRPARRARHHRHHLGRAARPGPASACDAAGLSERVDLRLQDYREVDGQFDAIVSASR